MIFDEDCMNRNSEENFRHIRKKAALRLLRMHYESKSGHVGGNFSCLDALLVLHHSVMTQEDRFILSKGHSAGALYVALWSLGLLSDADLETFCRENTALPGHPSGLGIPNLLFPTGSLGHGPSLAAGLALALKGRRATGRVFCLCSDGEWQEGSCWEALIFAVRQRLGNLVFLVDQNGLQGFGSTQEVAGVSDLAPRFQAFGAAVACADGHDPNAILRALAPRDGGEGPPVADGRPQVVVLRTRKGNGLHYEGKLESHYLPLSAEQYETAVQRINAGEA